MGLSSAFAQECNATTQSGHVYFYDLIPHNRVFPVAKPMIMDPKQKYAADIKSGAIAKNTPPPECVGTYSFVMQGSKKDFMRVAEDTGKISVNISDRKIKARPQDKRGCLDVPVKENKVVFEGVKATLHFTLDENSKMTSQRYGYLLRSYRDALQNVECYRVSIGEMVEKPVPKALAPKKAAPLPAISDAPVYIEPQKPKNILDMMFGN